MGLFRSTTRGNLPATRSNYDDFFKQFDEMVGWPAARWETEARAIAPLVNIQETKEGYHVEAELPGVNKDDVHVNIKDEYLVIKGDKRSYNEETKDQYHRIERSHGTFYRAIALPGDIDREKISAELKDGVLKVDIAKATQPGQAERRIAIK